MLHKRESEYVNRVSVWRWKLCIHYIPRYKEGSFEAVLMYHIVGIGGGRGEGGLGGEWECTRKETAV